MRPSLFRLLLLTAVPPAFLVGCTSIGVQTPNLSASPKDQYSEVYTAAEARQALDKKFFLHPLPTDTYTLMKSCRDNIVPQNSDCLKDRVTRDWIQNELLKRSDQICTAYQTRLIHAFAVGSAGVQIGQGIVKALLVPAAIAEATFQGLSGSVFAPASNEILQHNQFMAVNKRIYAKREMERAAILKKQDDLDINRYTLPRAVYDAEVYHSYCNYAVQLAAGEPPPK